MKTTSSIDSYEISIGDEEKERYFRYSIQDVSFYLGYLSRNKKSAAHRIPDIMISKGLGYSWKEIADKYNRSVTRIQQQYATGLDLLNEKRLCIK